MVKPWYIIWLRRSFMSPNSSGRSQIVSWLIVKALRSGVKASFRRRSARNDIIRAWEKARCSKVFLNASKQRQPKNEHYSFHLLKNSFVNE